MAGFVHDVIHFPRPRVILFAVLIAALGVSVLASPAVAAPSKPSCAGQQWLAGLIFIPHNQIFFNCDQTIRSFRVSQSAQLYGTSPVAVERNGVSQPPPQGFACSPPHAAHSVTCAGLATRGNLVRDTVILGANPCVGRFTTIVTVGTGPPDASGNPTGRTRTFSLGPLRGCRVAIPGDQTCAGAQFLSNGSPTNGVEVLFSCKNAVRSFRFRTSKVNQPSLDPMGGTVIGTATVERNGNSQPSQFSCMPDNPPAPRSFGCSPSLGTGAASGDLVRTGFYSRQNPCEPVTTTVTTGTGPLDSSGNPTGKRTTLTLGPLQGCSVALRRRPAPPPAPRCPNPTGSTRAGVNQGHVAGGGSAENDGGLAQQNAGRCR